MTVRELITELLEYPMDSIAYIGKGMGPVRELHPAPGSMQQGSPDVVILEPES